VIRGEKNAMLAWLEKCNQTYHPHILCVAIASDSQNLTDALAERSPLADGVIAYLCHGQSCKEPITQLDKFEEWLRDNSN